MDARIVVSVLFLCLSTGYTMKNDDANDDILDLLKETDALNEAPDVQADPTWAYQSSTSYIIDQFTEIPAGPAAVATASSSWSLGWGLREHKISTAATLLHRALKLPNSESGKAREIDRISIALQSNGYPPKVTADIIRKKSSNPPTPSPEELVGMFFSWADPMNSQSFAVLPYIKGITEPLTRILKSHDIRVTNKPIKTLQQELPVPKFRPPVDDQCNVVYKIPCASCPWSYIGATKRSFSTRRKEHIRNTKQCAKGSNVAKHAWTLDHAIDFENAEIVDKGNNRIRKTLESWHTAKTVEADNNSCPLPGQYNILLNKQ
ncbi:hypothetical protein ACROYT_G027570 [Oculina patagonica]